jgi:hypothetical protein
MYEKKASMSVILRKGPVDIARRRGSDDRTSAFSGETLEAD